jgi:hypothetical protein
MKKFLACFALFCGLAAAQGGGYGQPTVLLGPYVAYTSSGPQPSKPTTVPFLGTGMIDVALFGITGSPSNCQVQLSFGGTNDINTGFISTATLNVGSLGGTNVEGRATTSSIGPFTTISLRSWSCSTFPTGGSFTVEFIPDPSPVFLYNHISTNTTTIVRALPGFLHAFTINAPGTTETVTIFDNSTCAAPSIAVITPTVTTTLTFDTATITGICVQTAGTTAGDYTVSYR